MSQVCERSRSYFFSFIAIVAFAFSGYTAAQSYTPTTDVLGAHNNGGRGCAGCHAPHSGSGGSGGSTGIHSPEQTDHNSGDDALFAQDLGPLYGYTLNMGDGGRYVETLPARFAAGDEEIRGIAMCLACHDGAVAKGAMMVGTSYEQRMGLLPSGVYGPKGIPTLLGADGMGTGYNNDHPVGVQATLGAAGLFRSTTDTTNITAVIGATGITSLTPTAGSKYANFVADYGMPSIGGVSDEWGVASPSGNTDPMKLFITCTTCHNQHVMNLYQGNGRSGRLLNGQVFKTYFFIRAPYNIDNMNQGGTTFTNAAPSATQFCRQCHFTESNEYYGLNLATKF